MFSSLSRRLALLAVMASLGLVGCLDSSETKIDDQGTSNSQFNWVLPAYVPRPVEPDFNPMTEDKFQLGRHLFYDERLSAGGNISCASCHHQDKAFADGRVVPIGTHGESHRRNAQALVNPAWFATLNWGNPVTDTLERQIEGPLFGDDPHEHGINDTNREAILADLLADPTYTALFSAAFPNESAEWNYNHIIFALASFTRGMVSYSSPYDTYLAENNIQAISVSARRGMDLFNSERLECFHCHGGYNFSNSVMDRSRNFPERNFHNTGLYNLAGSGNYPVGNTGIHDLTGDIRHMGQFRTPTLRNIALTAPYSHDGSHATLKEIIATYAAGGRHITSGVYVGDGRLNPNKDGFIAGFSLNAQEEKDLIAFLCSLTDEAFTTNPRLSNPWPDENGNPRPAPINPGVPKQCLQ
ncbi:MAG TPA: di-heme enzyme [Marinospirillum sp.]|uniref:MbnH family di-heme enzyme n=1 Tax=Marinospirillum sp. TaxID=2183934 RepID=UPI002B477885|nr:MbnH family di-heme enzyme [Marinospirillum sp.]HKM15386.1 di-heme enzyme [Marinospirillum sp.]